MVVQINGCQKVALPKCPGRTRPRICKGSTEWLGSMHRGHLDIDLFGNTRHQWSTKRSDSAHLYTRLVDKPRKLWKTFAGTCNIGLADTNSASRFGLLRLVVCRALNAKARDGAYQI